jgi:hypothetical protein
VSAETDQLADYFDALATLTGPEQRAPVRDTLRKVAALIRAHEHNLDVATMIIEAARHQRANKE